MFKKLTSKNKRMLAYVGIIGGFAVLALTFFTICQYQKAKCKSSEMMLNSCKSSLEKLVAKDTSEFDAATLAQHEKLIEYWRVATIDFNNIYQQNSGAYKGTAIPAYIFSMATLVSFGLVLKDAEKVKDKEDKEVA